MQAIEALPWPDLFYQLDTKGYAVIPGLLDSQACKALSSQYDQSNLYRSVISMQRYRFGKGEYKYFAYPLPDLVKQLRESFYKPLRQLASQWMEKLKLPATYPEMHDEFIAACHEAGQLRPTPLILRYEAGGYNTLHQDLYGAISFPFQVVILLSAPGTDHSGGELIFVEQLPRAQSKATVVAPAQGDAIIFTTNYRPVNGSRGWFRSRMKHGVSEINSGVRFALGIIFHDGA